MAGGIKILPKDTDMNNVDTNGKFFLTSGQNIAASFSYYEVFRASSTLNSDCYQIAFTLVDKTPIRTRARINGTWSNWIEK